MISFTIYELTFLFFVFFVSLLHTDTPVHAAASSGCAECTELLLTALAAEKSVSVDTGVTSVADLKNNMEMTPAHLCSTAEALEVLFR